MSETERPERCPTSAANEVAQRLIATFPDVDALFTEGGLTEIIEKILAKWHSPVSEVTDPFSKGYKYRDGQPVSDACGDNRHAQVESRSFLRRKAAMRGESALEFEVAQPPTAAAAGNQTATANQSAAPSNFVVPTETDAQAVQVPESADQFWKNWKMPKDAAEATLSIRNYHLHKPSGQCPLWG